MFSWRGPVSRRAHQVKQEEESLEEERGKQEEGAETDARCVGKGGSLGVSERHVVSGEPPGCTRVVLLEARSSSARRRERSPWRRTRPSRERRRGCTVGVHAMGEGRKLHWASYEQQRRPLRRRGGEEEEENQQFLDQQQNGCPSSSRICRQFASTQRSAPALCACWGQRPSPLQVPGPRSHDQLNNGAVLDGMCRS